MVHLFSLVSSPMTSPTNLRKAFNRFEVCRWADTEPPKRQPALRRVPEVPKGIGTVEISSSGEIDAWLASQSHHDAHNVNPQAFALAKGLLVNAPSGLLTEHLSGRAVRKVEIAAIAEGVKHPVETAIDRVRLLHHSPHPSGLSTALLSRGIGGQAGCMFALGLRTLNSASPSFDSSNALKNSSTVGLVNSTT